MVVQEVAGERRVGEVSKSTPECCTYPSLFSTSSVVACVIHASSHLNHWIKKVDFIYYNMY